VAIDSRGTQLKDNNTLRFGALTDTCLHICVDMQRLFADNTDWHTPWMERVLPNALRIVEAHPAQTIFTRFIPAEEPGQGRGTWRRYYQNWESMTISRLEPEMVELVAELKRFVPPAQVIDKRVYSPWLEGNLDDMLRGTKSETLVVSGGETDVCVLATVLGAVDRGYRVVVATDALCSSSDETHDAMMTLYHNRYGQQVETVTTDIIVENWRPSL
jgi:nicotinamidase-related amidase